MNNHLGKVRHNINVSDAFKEQASADEYAARILFENGMHKQSAYFIIQAMEKLIRAKIFNLVDAKKDYFRDRNRTHSVEDAAHFLLEILSTDDLVKQQVSSQLNTVILGKIKYNYLHNNLRYPFYSKKYNSYSSLTLNTSDTNSLFTRLNALKIFLKDIDNLK